MLSWLMILCPLSSARRPATCSGDSPALRAARMVCRSAACRSIRDPFQRRAAARSSASAGLYALVAVLLRFSSRLMVDGARSRLAAICRIELPSA